MAKRSAWMRRETVDACKLDGRSLNPQAELVEVLKSRCPEVFTEGKVDVELLKRTLGEEAGENGGWTKPAKNLKAEIDEELIII